MLCKQWISQFDTVTVIPGSKHQEEYHYQVLNTKKNTTEDVNKTL